MKSNPTTLFLTLFTIFGVSLISYGVWMDFSAIPTVNLENILKISVGFISSILGLVFVVLEVKAFKSMFVVGIVGSIASIIYLALWSPLLWDLSISFVYVILNIYGLYYWNHSQNQSSISVIVPKTLSIKEIAFYSLISCIAIAGLSFVGITIGKYSSNLQAITDAVTTVLAILAQWLVSQKYIEMWILWIAVNIISIPLYISIGAYAYVMVYICYLIISFYGYYHWYKNMLLPNNKVLAK